MRKTLGTLTVLAGMLAGPLGLTVAQPQAIAPEKFQELHSMIKPQEGENRFHRVDWLLDMHAAREKAAAQGKPIFVWAGAGGQPVGVC